MQTKQLYFIELVCPEPLQGEITAIKNYFFEKYNCKAALESPAHAILIPPLELKYISKDDFAPKTTGFYISIKNNLTVNQLLKWKAKILLAGFNLMNEY